MAFSLYDLARGGFSRGRPGGYVNGYQPTQPYGTTNDRNLPGASSPPGIGTGAASDLTATPYSGGYASGTAADRGGSVTNQPGFGAKPVSTTPYYAGAQTNGTTMATNGAGTANVTGSATINNGIGASYGTSPGVVGGTYSGTGMGANPSGTTINPTNALGKPTFGAGTNGWRSVFNGDPFAVQGSAGAANVGLMGKISHGYDPATGQWHANEDHSNQGAPMSLEDKFAQMTANGFTPTPEQQALVDQFKQQAAESAKFSAINTAAFGAISDQPGGNTPQKWAANWAASQNGNDEAAYKALAAKAPFDEVANAQLMALNQYYATLPDPKYAAFLASGQPGTYAGANFAPPEWWYGASGAQPSVVGTPGAIPGPVSGMGRNTNGKP